MKTKLALVGLVSASLLFAACGGDDEAADTTAAPAVTEAPAATDMPAEPGDIVAVASSNADFETLVAAVGAAGLVETLQGAGPFTVFAPTDAAFEALPAGLVDKLLLPENKETLVAILTYHVVAGQVLEADVAAGDVPSVQGENITVTTDGGVKVNGANVVATDVMASNGVIHVIDAVILPPSLDISAL
ncbi:MAG: hypothetical protein RI958_329 [Actinomycetota bacterium]|jgi:uncharacterized surface protein with fasciclin (FAS1) repeats